MVNHLNHHYDDYDIIIDSMIIKKINFIFDYFKKLIFNTFNV